MLKFAQIREDMSLDVDHMKSLITEKTKLVTMVSLDETSEIYGSAKRKRPVSGGNSRL